MSDLWKPLLLSLQIATAATALAAVAAIPLAFAMARARRFRGKSLLEGLILIPLVLPPTVVGFAIIMLLGVRGLLGQWLMRWFGYSIVFRFEGAVLAAAVVALPLIYIPAKAAFATVARELEEIARLFGANQVQVFWHVSLPLARRGIVSGTVLGFARALGEFGATVMVFGWQPNRVTLPISVYTDWVDGQLSHATGAVVALALISFSLVLAYNSSSVGRQE